MNDNFKHYAKRLTDYVRIYIEVHDLRPRSPLSIAYREFMEQWKILEAKSISLSLTQERLAEILNKIDSEFISNKILTPYYKYVAAELLKVCDVREKK